MKGEAFEGGTAALARRWTLIGGEGKATLESRGLKCLQGIVGVGLLVQTSTAGEQAHYAVHDGPKQDFDLVIGGGRQCEEGGL